MTVTYRAGVDIGGTFTDIVLLGSDGTVHTKKISSSVGNYAQAIVDGLSEVFGETAHIGDEHQTGERPHPTRYRGVAADRITVALERERFAALLAESLAASLQLRA